jgi:predicted PurR-regulated permease PerM
VQGLQLVEEAVALAGVPAGAAFLCALVVLVHVVELLLALLGASLVAQVGELPESHNSDKKKN